MAQPFFRHVQNALMQWKNGAGRKPLVIRGARQVGKSTLVHQFSSNYKQTIALNLERETHVRYFKDFSDVTTLVQAIFTKHSISFGQLSETLLFLDEIQESPKAIALLRYFYEDLPGLHVIAAGSLLEHALGGVKNFPVGRVQYLYLHPFNFFEFLKAKGHQGALDAMAQVPVPHYAQATLLELFNEYAIIGGMPEVVQRYLEHDSLPDLAIVYENIWETYKNDVEKYARNASERKIIKHIMATAHRYLDQRVKFQNFGSSNYKSREVGEAFRNLDDAKVIQLVHPCTNLEPPVQTDYKKSPRLQFLDTGLVNYDLNIQADMLAMKDLSTSFRGAIIPHLVTQELVSLNVFSNKKPHFWVREKTQSSSEVDLVYPHKNLLIPIEIKSGKVGKLRSLHQFVERAPHPYAVRMYGGEFSVERQKTASGKPFYLMNLPYYLTTRLEDYIAYFIKRCEQGPNGQ
ncbi:ATP-binding protein [Maribacter sp. 2307ULW6-5]|uniref:ATP-binding protein n=1 Tax=Maribacter sp. 2307ULW6-5 TaxID=3386275 RepID=UPI0039BD6A6A